MEEFQQLNQSFGFYFKEGVVLVLALLGTGTFSKNQCWHFNKKEKKKISISEPFRDLHPFTRIKIKPEFKYFKRYPTLLLSCVRTSSPQSQ